MDQFYLQIAEHHSNHKKASYNTKPHTCWNYDAFFMNLLLRLDCHYEQPTSEYIKQLAQEELWKEKAKEKRD